MKDTSNQIELNRTSLGYGRTPRAMEMGFSKGALFSLRRKGLIQAVKVSATGGPEKGQLLWDLDSIHRYILETGTPDVQCTLCREFVAADQTSELQEIGVVCPRCAKSSGELRHPDERTVEVKEGTDTEKGFDV